MKKYHRILAACVLGIITLYLWYQYHPLQITATIHGQTFVIELAIMEAEKRKGLGERKNLPKDHGMLFLMGEPAYHGFWMKEMRFPLDFIWINGDKIVDLTQNVPNPVGNEPSVNLKPRTPVDKVLEVNAGTIALYNLSVGDTVFFKN